jgi:glyoxylase-like metal-dependent hydrolase (beta-lactamase superfamily II)
MACYSDCKFVFIGLMLVSAAFQLRAQSREPENVAFQPGVLPKQWASGGPKCMEMPPWQIHEYNPDLYILRQSGCTDYEKPFVYLLFGKQSALLLDTGSHHGNLAPMLVQTVKNWLTRNQRASIPLLVVHSHSHWDHTDGDDAIEALHDPAMPVTMVKATPEADAKFFHITHWPDDIGGTDLGDRVIDAIPIPGHDAASIALYDRATALLFTGDSINAGRIYVSDWDAYIKSNQRMIDFTKDKPVSFLLGCHIEQTRTPYRDYPMGTMYQPDEAPLELSRSELLEVQRAVDRTHGTPARLVLPWYTIWPLTHEEEVAPSRKAAIDRVFTEQRQHMWNRLGN